MVALITEGLKVCPVIEPVAADRPGLDVVHAGRGLDDALRLAAGASLLALSVLRQPQLFVWPDSRWHLYTSTSLPQSHRQRHVSTQHRLTPETEIAVSLPNRRPVMSYPFP